MIRHKSALKAHKQSLKRALRNKIVKTRIKTFSRKVEAMVALKDHAQALAALRAVEPVIMRAVSKKVLKLNTASRKVSKLTQKVKLLDKPADSRG